MKEKEKKELLDLLRWYKNHVESERWVKSLMIEVRKQEMEDMWSYQFKPKPWIVK